MILVGLVLLVGAGALLMWTRHARESVPTAGQLRAYPRFAKDSAVTLDVSGLPVDPHSDRMIRHLLDQIEPHFSGVAALNVHQYSASLYVVDSTTPRGTVNFHDCQGKGSVPYGLFDGPLHFVDVPVPVDAVVAPGRDQALSLWSPSTDQLWEFWKMQQRNGRWEACWGGRIDAVSQNPGQFEFPYGATATGVPMVGTMLRVQDVAQGSIDHALGLTLIAPAEATRFRFPANRSDGNDPSPAAIPEGARLRLDPAVDVDSLDLTPVGRLVARAAQKYGFIVVDKAGAVSVIGESGLPEERATGVDPWDDLLQGPSYDRLRNFPWDRMEVLQDEEG